jgi:hypothetical protein
MTSFRLPVYSSRDVVATAESECAFQSAALDRIPLKKQRQLPGWSLLPAALIGMDVLEGSEIEEWALNVSVTGLLRNAWRRFTILCLLNRPSVLPTSFGQ